MKELAEESTLKQYMVTDCIKILVRNGQVIKEQEPVSFWRVSFTASLSPATKIIFLRMYMPSTSWM